jgi:hypothetical protein
MPPSLSIAPPRIGRAFRPLYIELSLNFYQNFTLLSKNALAFFPVIRYNLP